MTFSVCLKSHFAIGKQGKNIVNQSNDIDENKRGSSKLRSTCSKMQKGKIHGFINPFEN